MVSGKNELLMYIKQHFPDNLIKKSNFGDLLLWAHRGSRPTELLPLAVTLNTSILEHDVTHLNLDNFIVNPGIAKRITCGQHLADYTGVGFWVITYPSIINDKRPNLLLIDVKDQKIVDSYCGTYKNFSEILQEKFGTDYEATGTGKPVNKRTADSFHLWARENMPAEYARTDIDGLIVNDNNVPKLLLEIKRSNWSFDKWDPRRWRRDDSRNYLLQYVFANNEEIEFWTLFHPIYNKVNDEHIIKFYNIKNVVLSIPTDEWITYHERSVIKAKELIDRIKPYVDESQVE